MYDIIDLIQGSDEWLEWRKTGVTATCTPILRNESRYLNKTPYMLYLEYIGAVLPPDLSVIPQVATGRLTEQFARHWFEEKFGVLSSPYCVQNQQHKHLIASLDGLTENNEVVEIKNLSDNNHLEVLSERNNSEAYHFYKWQVYHQMVTVGAKYGYLVFWSAKHSPIVFKLCITNDIKNEVIKITSHFMNCIINKKAPEYDFNRDFMLLNNEAVMEDLNIKPSEIDAQLRINKLKSLHEIHVQKTKEIKKLKLEIDSLNSELSDEVSVLKSVLKLPANAPLRFEGYGFRFLETDISPRFLWAKLGKKLNIKPESHPDCYSNPSRRLSVCSYNFSDNSKSISDYFDISGDTNRSLDNFNDYYEYL